MKVYYNEFDPFASSWLLELMGAGLIPSGKLDVRDMQTVLPSELKGYTRCHFFAGIAGWELALQLAGWPREREVWTGSCPCQPFSAAGKGGGINDPRHLWPDWFRIIRKRRPQTIFGEQVASAAGLRWFDAVCSDLEGEGYAIGAADLCAAGVGAPHIRQRLWFVADAGSERRQQDARGTFSNEASDGGTRRDWSEPDSDHESASDGAHASRLDDANAPGLPGRAGDTEAAREGGAGVVEAGQVGGLAHGNGQRRDGESVRLRGRGPQQASPEVAWSSGVGRLANPGCSSDERERRLGHPHGAASPPEGEVAQRERGRLDPWSRGGLAWLPCRDGKARPTQPGLFPLAHGVPNRVGTLRGAGNAIVPQVAATFIRAFLQASDVSDKINTPHPIDKRVGS